jgi:type IV pilus assembly protein PilX
MNYTAYPNLTAHKSRHPSHRNESGAVLATTLVFLLVTTIVGVTAITRSTFDERIAGNLRDRNNAFESAELALRYAEAIVSEPDKRKLVTIIDKDEPFDYFDNEWDDTKTIELTSSRTATVKSEHDFALMAEEPVFVIQEDEPYEAPVGSAFAWSKERSAFYKITARGHGVNSPAVVVVQSRYLLLEREGDE